MAEFVKVGDRWVNLDAVALVEPDQQGGHEVCIRGPAVGGGGGLYSFTADVAEVRELLRRIDRGLSA
jgi:hypothetical protein